MLKSKLKQEMARYNASSEAARTLWHAFIDAECIEVTENGFTPRLDELHKYGRVIKDVEKKLQGGYDALWRLNHSLPRTAEEEHMLHWLTRWDYIKEKAGLSGNFDGRATA